MTRIIEVRQNILKQNDLLARQLRERFAAAGVYVASFVAGPGAGKTTLLEKLAPRLMQHCRVGVLVGDLATENDARRLAHSGARVRQITTGTVCHLDAQMIAKALEGWNLADLDIVLIENVGNLVCPSSYDLGENIRFVLTAVTEGEDKPLKYPTIFNSADVAVITKMDLTAVLCTDMAALHANIQAVRPGMPVLETSARTGQGMAPLAERLLGTVLRATAAAKGP